MKFMLMIHDNKEFYAKAKPEQIDGIVKQHHQFSKELGAKKKIVDGQRLRPASEAATVRVKNGKRVVLDGPFAETKEVFAGFYIVNCESKDEAIEWAKKLPIFDHDAVEVRPIWE